METARIVLEVAGVLWFVGISIEVFKEIRWSRRYKQDIIHHKEKMDAFEDMEKNATDEEKKKIKQMKDFEESMFAGSTDAYNMACPIIRKTMKLFR